jgi:hypothetical protein
MISGGNADVTIQDISKMFDNDIVGITNNLSNTTFPYMGRMRHSDINIDGYPDVFLTLTLNNPSLGSNFTQSVVIISMPCTDDTCNA